MKLIISYLLIDPYCLSLKLLSASQVNWIFVHVPHIGHMINGSFVNISQPAMLLPQVEETIKFSSPMPTGSMVGKRKASGSTPKLSPPPKKCCSGLTKISHNMDGKINLPIKIQTFVMVHSCSYIVQEIFRYHDIWKSTMCKQYSS